jgi:hypothetical protein
LEDFVAVLKFLGAIFVLFASAGLFHGVGQMLEGRTTVYAHFGWMTLVAALGAILYPFWGWTSTLWLVGGAAAWTIAPGLWIRLFGEGKPGGYLYHGDSPDSDNPDARFRNPENPGDPPPRDRSKG